MYARRAFRGIAAGLVAAALFSGGVFADPAIAIDEVAGASQAEIGTASDASELLTPTDDPPTAADDTGVVQNAGDVPAPETPALPSESSDESNTNTAIGDGSEDPASPLSADGAEVPGPVAPTGEAASVPGAVDDRVAQTAKPAMKLVPKISAKNSLAVQASVTGMPSDVTEVTAIMLSQLDEERIESNRTAITPIGTVTSPVVNGAVDLTLKASLGELTRDTAYAVVLWPTASELTVDSILVRGDVVLTNDQWDELYGTVPAAVAEVGSLQWGVLDRFRAYIEGDIAKGEIMTLGAAKYDGTKFNLPQIAGGKWNAQSKTGSVQYSGGMRFYGHDGQLDLSFENPVITVKSANRAELTVYSESYDFKAEKWVERTAVLATIDLSTATRTERKGGAVRWAGASATLTKIGNVMLEGYYKEGQRLDPITFTVGAESKDVKPVPPTTKPKPKPITTKPVPKPLVPAPNASEGGAQAAGSLSWGVSSAFAKYVTGPIAKGEVSTTGVGGSGGAYLFPQAAGGSWDTATQTGSVQYSGVVSFTGHKGLLQEGVSNPMIQVTGPDSAVIYSGGAQWGTLNLGAASKSVGANGEVTWSGVPVTGGFSGGASGGNQYSLPADPLTFTVGVASGVSYGSTAVSNESLKRTAASAPPTTTGIRILTDAKKLVPGGEIEFEAAGFESKEREALVVLYPGAIVLDEAAGADAAGTLRWLGTIPEDTELGEYVITVQGSTDAGAVIEVREPEKKSKAAAKQKTVEELAAEATQAAPAAAGILPTESSPVWVWWAASAGLLLIAGTMGGLVVAQRKRAAAGVDTQLSPGNSPPAP